MALTRSSPGDDRRRDLAATLLPAAAMAACAAVAISLAPEGARSPVAECGLVAIVVVALLAARAARQDRVISALRRVAGKQESDLLALLADQEARAVRLVRGILPGAIDRLRRGGSVEDVLADVKLDPETSYASEAAHGELLRSVLDAVRAEEDLRDGAQRAVMNIARRVQALVHQQSQDLREMEDRHGAEPAVFGDLLRVDHGTALIGRLADSLAVIAGASPGRQWPHEVPLFSVLRGAMSRVIDYPRVEIHSVVEAGVAGPAVEPVIHALAELLDNATRYSPPNTNVHLTAIEVQAGIAVEIEDAGVGLGGGEGVERAERRLAQDSKGLNLADLGETPRLGLLVVGRLARAAGFQVSLRPSAYGGVRAVLVIPNGLITAPPVTALSGSSQDGGAWSGIGPVGAGPGVEEAAALSGADESGLNINSDRLPQRRRSLAVHAFAATPGLAAVSSGLAAAPGSPTADDGASTPADAQPGLWLSAFHSGLNGTSPNAATTNSHIGDTSPGEDEEPS